MFRFSSKHSLLVVYITWFSVTFFNCYLAVPWPSLGHCRGGSVTNSILISVYRYLYDLEVTRSLVMRCGLNRDPSHYKSNALNLKASLPKDSLYLRSIYTLLIKDHGYLPMVVCKLRQLVP